MAQITKPTAIETDDDGVRVRYADPEEFETIRTPNWAETAANSVIEGSELRMGKRNGSDGWEPQSVLIPEPTDVDQARRQADEILQRIEF